MKERYSFIEPWDNLQHGAHEGIVFFALEQSIKNNCELRVCINNKSSCEQIITKAFGEENSKKIRIKKSISLNNVQVSLNSIATLKKEYNPPKAIFLLFFPSFDLITLVESFDNAAAIIVFSGADNHTEPTDKWLSLHDVHALKAKTGQ